MKIKVKNTLAAAEQMVRDGIPATVVATIAGKPFDVDESTEGFVVPCFDGWWNIAPDCVDIIQVAA